MNQKGDRAYCKPAGKAQKHRAKALGEELFQGSTQADGRHGHDDHKFSCTYQKVRHCLGDGQKGVCHSSKKKTKDEPGEHFRKAEGSFFLVSIFFSGSVNGKNHGNGNDQKGPCELDDGGEGQSSVVSCCAAPGSAGGNHGGSVVDRRSCPHAKARVAHSQKVSQGGEEEDGGNVEKENGGDGVCHILFLSVDDGGHGGDGRTAADGGAYADERG